VDQLGLVRVDEKLRGATLIFFLGLSFLCPASVVALLEPTSSLLLVFH
jgi:hypothetical protein